MFVVAAVLRRKFKIVRRSRYAIGVEAYAPHQDGRLFARLRYVPFSPNRHVAPYKAPPALRQHQKIECVPMFLVILLEIPTGIGNKTLYFGTKQHFRHDVPIIKI